MKISMPSDIRPFIKLHGDNMDMIGEVETALYKLDKLLTGKNLLNKLQSLSTGGKKLSIYAGNQLKTVAMPALSQSQIQKYRLEDQDAQKLNSMAYELCTKRRRHNKKEGTSANVFFDPTRSRTPDRLGEPQQGVYHFDNHFTLGHVLIHAMRMMKGNYQGGYMDHYHPDNPLQQREELRAIGLGEFVNRPISENKMRQEAGLAPYLSTRRA